MAYQQNDMRGSLFTNTYKNQQDPSDRSPHFKGRCLIQGIEWWVAGWWAYPQNGGQPYIQLRFEPPRPQQNQGGYAPQNGCPQGQPQQGYAPQPGYQQPAQPQQQPQYQQGYQQMPQQQNYQQTAQPQYQQPAPQGGYPPQGGDNDLPFGNQ